MAAKTIGRFEAYKVTNLVNGKLYFGITTAGIKERWAQHKREAKGRPVSVLHRAIAKYGVSKFKIELSGTANSWDDLCTLEAALIKTANSLSPRGYNMTTGGDGAYNFSDEMRNGMSKRMIAHWKSPHIISAAATRMRVRMALPGIRAEIAEQQRARWAAPGVRSAMAEMIKERMSTPEARAAQSEISRNKWMIPEARALMSERIRISKSTPSAVAAFSSRMRDLWASDRDAWSASISAARSTAESKALTSKQMRTHWAAEGVKEAHAEKMRERWANPEFRTAQCAALSAGVRAGHARRRAAKLATTI